MYDVSKNDTGLYSAAYMHYRRRSNSCISFQEAYKQGTAGRNTGQCPYCVCIRIH